MNSQRRALLIGIDLFPSLAGRDLKGCVADAEAVRDVLTRRYGFAPAAITFLRDGEATRQGILAAVDRLIEDSQPDDVVTIFCASHGVQQRVSDGSKASGFAEAIAAHDVYWGAGRFENVIAEGELRQRLRRLAEITPYVTLIFDCCHSATLHRDPRLDAGGLVFTGARYIEAPEDVQRAAPAPGADPDDERIFGANVLPDPSRYVVLAACRNRQIAGEVRVGQQHRGRFSYWLVKEMQSARPDLSYRSLMQLVRAQFPGTEGDNQQPQLEGAVDRHLFGQTEDTFARHALARVDGAQVALDVGAVHGVVVGARFGLVSPRDGLPVAECVVRRVSGFSAVASVASGVVSAGTTLRAVEAGRPRAARLSVGVLAAGDSGAEALGVAALLDSPLAVGVAGDATTALTARLLVGGAGGRWTIYEGEAPLPLPQAERGDGARLRMLVEQVAHARQLLRRRNQDVDSDLSGQVKVEFSSRDAGVSIELGAAPAGLTIYDGQDLRVRISNQDPTADLYYLVLWVHANGTVEQRFPPAGAAAQALAKGTSFKDGMHLELDQPGVAEESDFVVLIASAPIDATSLVQRAIDAPPVAGLGARATALPLAEEQRWAAYCGHLTLQPLS